MIRSLLLIFSSFVFIRCTTVVKAPFSHLQTPEVGGQKIGVTLGGGSGLRRNVYLVPDSKKGSTTAVTKSGKEFDGGAVAALMLSVDFLERFSAFSYGNLWGLQFQLLGSPRNQAKAGNFAVSLVGGYHYGITKGTTIVLGSDSDVLLNGEVKVGVLLASLVMGYRFNDNIGFGVNVFGEQYTSKATGTVSGSPSPESLSDFTTDYGVGLQLYGGTEKFTFLLSPMLAQFKEPVRGVASTYTFIAVQGGYSF